MSLLQKGKRDASPQYKAKPREEIRDEELIAWVVICKDETGYMSSPL